MTRFLRAYGAFTGTRTTGKRKASQRAPGYFKCLTMVLWSGHFSPIEYWGTAHTFTQAKHWMTAEYYTQITRIAHFPRRRCKLRPLDASHRPEIRRLVGTTPNFKQALFAFAC